MKIIVNLYFAFQMYLNFCFFKYRISITTILEVLLTIFNIVVQQIKLGSLWLFSKKLLNFKSTELLLAYRRYLDWKALWLRFITREIKLDRYKTWKFRPVINERGSNWYIWYVKMKYGRFISLRIWPFYWFSLCEKAT